MSQIDSVSAAIPGLSRRARTIAMWVVLLAFFMDLLDNTIVNVAIPSIQEHLGASYSAIQWIIAGYALAFALFLITGGRLGDIFGYKRMFLLGMAGFTAASALAGLSGSAGFLIGARLVQGFAAAIMVPQILSTIQVMFTDPQERQGISAFYGALGGLASVAGPILGALLIQGNVLGLGWRGIFLVNVPVGLAALVLAARYMPAARSPHPLHVDLVGFALILIAMLMLMYPLIQGRELGWPAWTLATMAASLAVFLLFAWSQRAKDRRDGSPLVVPSLFRARSFVAGLIINGAFFAVMSGFFLILTLFLQIGLQWPVLEAGLSTIPFSVGVGLAAGLSGPVLVPRFGRTTLTAGALVMAAGVAVLGWTAAAAGGALNPWELIPGLLLGGLGMGCIVAAVFPFVLVDVPVQHAGSASGVISTVGQIGGAIGIALVGVIFFGLIGSEARPSVAQVEAGLAADLTAAGVPALVQPAILDGVAACFVDRAQQNDPTAVPESCRQAEAAGRAFAALPGGPSADIGALVTARALEANRINFTTAFLHTIRYEIGGLLIIALLTLLLPKRPRQREAEFAMA